MAGIPQASNLWDFATEINRYGPHLLPRLHPDYWRSEAPRPAQCACWSGPDSLRMDVAFYTTGDYAALLWESRDDWDHVMLAYTTNRDYRGVVLEFILHTSNIAMPSQGTPNAGPRVFFDGRDAAGVPFQKTVNLAYYAEPIVPGNPALGLRVVLPFDALLAEIGATFIYVGDLDRVFVGVYPEGFIPGGTALLPVPVVGYFQMTSIKVTSPPLLMFSVGASHTVRAALTYDAAFHLTPARIVRQMLELGYQGTVSHYIGNTFYFRLDDDFGTGQLKVTWNQSDAYPFGGHLSRPFQVWHADYFRRLKAAGLQLLLSASYEIDNERAYDVWKQRDHNGQPVVNGLMIPTQHGPNPPTTMLSPTNDQAMGYIANVLQDCCDLAFAAGLDIRVQLREPTWSVSDARQQDGLLLRTPYYYDPSAQSKYFNETGLPAPLIESMLGLKTPTERLYLDWLGEKLAVSTERILAQLRARFGLVQSYVQVYAPWVIDAAIPDAYRAATPPAWIHPAFDGIELEEYEFVVGTQPDKSKLAAQLVSVRLGYPPAAQHYLSGVTSAEEKQVNWPLIYEALVLARDRDVVEVFVWVQQIVRDSVVIVGLPMPTGPASWKGDGEGIDVCKDTHGLYAPWAGSSKDWVQ